MWESCLIYSVDRCDMLIDRCDMLIGRCDMMIDRCDMLIDRSEGDVGELSDESYSDDDEEETMSETSLLARGRMYRGGDTTRLVCGGRDDSISELSFR